MKGKQLQWVRTRAHIYTHKSIYLYMLALAKKTKLTHEIGGYGNLNMDKFLSNLLLQMHPHGKMIYS